MPRVMIFIDGSWLYYSKSQLGEQRNKSEFFIDYGRLPDVLCRELKAKGEIDDLDLVRNHLYGSYAWNPDESDTAVVSRQRDFFDMLRDRYFYDVEIFPIDFKGRKLNRLDRALGDEFEPRERTVEVSLTASMMYYAALPGAFDIALIVAGDRDFIPLLRRLRQLGKRVAIASIHNHCCSEFSDSSNKRGIKDYPILWLDDYAEELELNLQHRMMTCESPLHDGDPQVLAAFIPKEGEKFYCDSCRRQYEAERRLRDEIPTQSSTYFDQSDTGELLSGKIKATFPERGFGFIAAANNCDYFFHNADLEASVQIEAVCDGDDVIFEVRRSASTGKAGAARNVSLRTE